MSNRRTGSVYKPTSPYQAPRAGPDQEGSGTVPSTHSIWPNTRSVIGGAWTKVELKATPAAAIRANLLSLQQTASLVARTQGRLSTGLKVASAIDDAVAFFQAKSLSDRAGDLTAKKNGIDQGISSLTTALQAVESAEDIFSQMKGLILTAKSGSSADRATLVVQFNELAVQADNLVNDSSYQGLNLVNSTANALKVSFSEKTGSVLNVDGANILVSNFVGLSGAAPSVIATVLTGLSIGWSAVGGSISLFDAAIDVMDSAITTIRTNASTLSSNWLSINEYMRRFSLCFQGGDCDVWLSSFVSERHLRTDVRPDERSTEYQRTEARPMHLFPLRAWPSAATDRGHGGL